MLQSQRAHAAKSDEYAWQLEEAALVSAILSAASEQEVGRNGLNVHSGSPQSGPQAVVSADASIDRDRANPFWQRWRLRIGR